MDSSELAHTVERLVGALIPAVPHRPEPLPISLTLLPVSPRTLSALAFDVGRPDASGRVAVRGLLQAPGWACGHRLDVTVVAGVLVLTTGLAGQYAVTAQGAVKLPAPARRLVGMVSGESVLLAAWPGDDILVAVPASMVEHWLRRRFVDASGER